jgi:hypothetical protein
MRFFSCRVRQTPLFLMRGVADAGVTWRWVVMSHGLTPRLRRLVFCRRTLISIGALSSV